MTTTTLLVGGLLSLLIGLVYAYVGLRLTQRALPGEAAMAVNLFGVWWFALAGSTMLTSARSLLHTVGAASVPLFTVLQYVDLLVITMGLLGLVYYLVYLFTGQRRILPYITTFYVLYYLSLLWALSRAGDAIIEVHAWSVQLSYVQPLEGALLQILLFLLIGPPLIAAGIYLSLLPRVDDATQRYRITLVGTSIMLWFGSAYGASLIGLSDASWWGLVSQFIGLAAALTILAAYLPPGWIQDRFDVETLDTKRRLATEPNG